MHPDVAAVLAVVRAFDGEVVDVRPCGGVGFPHVIGTDRRTVRAFAPCVECSTGTWTQYGDEALCRAHAWTRLARQLTRELSEPTRAPSAPPEAPWAGLFGQLFPGGAGFIDLRAFAGRGQPPAGRLFCAPSDDAAIANFAATHRGHDVYFGVAARRHAEGGTLADCVCLTTLFCDLDFKRIREADARDGLARCPLPPSAIVHSGGGLHAYWRLRTPLRLPDQAALAKQQLRALATRLGADLAAAEPARVLRLPGSYNVKPEYGAPRLVRIERLA
jgi:hypothetical protein